MIEIKGISKRFGKLQVLNNIHLQLKQGECIALVGPNGCGKTTLIKTILGMVLPEKGELLFDGKSIRNNNKYREEIGYMPQIGRYPENMTIGQIINMIQGIRTTSKPLDTELYDAFNIGNILTKKMRTLSGGTTQKVSAFLAFMFHPKVLILDEPTAGLDPIASDILKQKISTAQKNGCLILIASHLVSELEDMVSEVIFMQEGNMIMHQNIHDLKKITGKETLAKSIIEILKTYLK